MRHGLSLGVPGTAARTVSGTPAPSPVLDLLFTFGSLPGAVTVSRAGSATYFNDSGVMQTAGTNAARLDTDPASMQRRGLLVEPTRTNLALQSNTFSDAAWTKATSTITPAAATGPDGTASASMLVETAAGGVHNCNQPLALTSGQPYTVSVYAKAAGRDFLQIFFFSTGMGTTHFANFDLSAGVTGTAGSSATSSISSAGGGWYRCSVTCTATGTATGGYGLSTITSATAGRNQSFTGNASLGLYYFGAQCEAAAAPASSYIATAGSTVARAAETAAAAVANATYDILVQDRAGAEWRNGVVVSGGSYPLTPRSGQVSLARVRLFAAGAVSAGLKTTMQVAA